MYAALANAYNPDLRKYAALGNKLLVYFGWTDVSPPEATDYYETVEKTMGGRAATQDFFRLFMIPGMDHCSGGAGAFAIDYLSYMEAWVEQGHAPDKLIGAHINGLTWSEAFGLAVPAGRQDSHCVHAALLPIPHACCVQGPWRPKRRCEFYSDKIKIALVFAPRTRPRGARVHPQRASARVLHAEHYPLPNAGLLRPGTFTSTANRPPAKRSSLSCGPVRPQRADVTYKVCKSSPPNAHAVGLVAGTRTI